jgi:hypothetical protein
VVSAVPETITDLVDDRHYGAIHQTNTTDLWLKRLVRLISLEMGDGSVFVLLYPARLQTPERSIAPRDMSNKPQSRRSDYRDS